jgi:ATPase subunit of ABC transporter with duplicated ATPase domains
MKDFRGTILFTSRDHELANTVANRILEITPNGLIDREMSLDEYMTSDRIKALRKEMYNGTLA